MPVLGQHFQRGIRFLLRLPVGLFAMAVAGERRSDPLTGCEM
jgi:hypothetical protein